MSKSHAVNVNTEELKGILSHLVDNNRFLQTGGKTPVAMAVEGDAGIGKTSVIMQFAKEQGLDCVKLNLSQIEEIGDLVGFPTKEYEVKDASGATKWIPETAIPVAAEDGWDLTGEKRMKHAPPDWIQGRTEGGILILDDYTRADHRFLQACMELIDRQEYISWKLPKDWHIVLTTNPDDGNYLVNTIDDAQKTRFFTVNLAFDIKCWAKWAENNAIDGRCINFLILHPELISGKNKKVNARSITTFFNCISSFKTFEDNLPMISMLGDGSVGSEFSTLFATFINNKLDKLITPKEILTNKSWKTVKDEILNCTGAGKAYRADIGSLLTTRIVNYALYHAENHKVDDVMLERIKELHLDEDILSNDLKYYIMKGIMSGNKQKFQKLMMSKEIAEVVLK